MKTNKKEMPSSSSGEVAYNTYCQVLRYSTGEPLPKWPDVKPKIKLSWEAAAAAVACHYGKLLATEGLEVINNCIWHACAKKPESSQAATTPSAP